VDFHAGNVVGSDDQPVIIDTETLFHPSTFLPKQLSSEDSSIRRTGLLPALGGNSDDGRAEQLSLFGLVPKRYRSAEQIVAGFQAMRSFITSKSGRVGYLELVAARMRDVLGRRIFSPSKAYYGIAQGSLSTSLLRDGRDRSIYLWALCSRYGKPNRLVRREVEALENLDVPVFRCPPSRAQFDLSKESAESCIAVIRATLGNRRAGPASQDVERISV
jgi:lantibiotic modifying enzyme